MSSIEMNVKEAVKLAVGYVQELFLSEQLTDLGLEEVEYVDAANSWLVTVGFSRPWDSALGAFSVIAGAGKAKSRSFKVLTIKDGQVVSLRDRTKAMA